MKKKMIVPTIALVAILGAMTIGTFPVSAQSKTYSSLVQRIAQRFNLKESEVQEVLEEVRTEHMSEMTARFEERVSKLVADGKITVEQKNQIMQKHDAIHAVLTDSSLSDKERSEKEKQLRDDMKKWLKENNLENLFPMKGKGARGDFFRK